MAQRENMRDRIRKINPQALVILDKFDRQCQLAGCHGVSVTTTEDMTPEEEEMALFEGFIKEGYSTEEATAKAKDWLALLNDRKR